MKILVATKKTIEAPRPTDFCFAEEGEPVYKQFKCSSDNHGQSCHCPRSVAGLKSNNLTSLVRVADEPKFRDELDPQHESIARLRSVAEGFETGSVLEVTPQGFLLREGAHIWDDIIDG